MVIIYCQRRFIHLILIPLVIITVPLSNVKLTQCQGQELMYVWTVTQKTPPQFQYINIKIGKHINKTILNSLLETRKQECHGVRPYKYSFKP